MRKSSHLSPFEAETLPVVTPAFSCPVAVLRKIYIGRAQHLGSHRYSPFHFSDLFLVWSCNECLLCLSNRKWDSVKFQHLNL